MSAVDAIWGDGEVELADVRPAPTMALRQSEWMTFEDTGLTLEELGKPLLWRVLVFPKQPKKMSAGGIALPGQAQDVEMHLNYIGQVVAIGPLAGKNERYQNPEWVAPANEMRALYDTMMQGTGEWEEYERRVKTPTPDVPRYLWNVKPLDWVTYGKFSGQFTEYRGVRFLTVNDDDIMQVIGDPSNYRVYA